MLVGKQSRVRLLATLLALALIAAACGGDTDDAAVDGEPIEATDETGAPDEAEEPPDEDPVDDSIGVEVIEDDPVGEGPVAGGTLRFAIQAESDGINPATSALAASGHNMANAVFDQLAAFDEDNNVVPYLAESFTPNDDFTTWTVKLREGIEFHDGTPLNAEAVLVNFDSQRGDTLLGIIANNFYTEENPWEVIDELTFEVHLPEPNQFWPAFMAGQTGIIASPTWLAAALEDPELNQEPVGTGPFVFDSRVQDQETRFVRNDNYWNGEVYLDAIEFVVVTDADTRANLFLEGAVNGMMTNNPATVDVLVNEEGVQNALDDTASEQFALINSSAPPFDDIRARQALTFATPQDNYVALLGVGVARRADSMFAPGSPYYNPDVIQETDQPERAIEVATEYCADVPENCTDGKINMEYAFAGPDLSTTRESELLAEGWDVAFNVSFTETAQDTHILNTALGVYQVADWRQFGQPDPMNDNVWLMCRTIGGISLNWPKFCDEGRDELLLEAQNTADPDARAAIYQEVSARIQQDYLYLFEMHTVWDMAYAENVRGPCSRLSPEGVTLRCQNQGRTWYTSIWIDE